MPGAGFAARASLDGHCLLTRAVPPVTYTDGVVTIRPLRADDIDRHMEAIDDEQIDWLWEPGDRAKWKAMTPAQRREHNVAYLQGLPGRLRRRTEVGLLGRPRRCELRRLRRL